MPQSLAKVYLHTVFSTKFRQPLILPEVEESLYAYIGGIIKQQNSIPLAINGMPDHIHLLSTLPRTITIAKYLEAIKKSSSKWIKGVHPNLESFAWQGGYATFSVSSSKVDVVRQYIKRQKTHHQKLTFKEEVIQFLEKYQMEYDERYLWD